MTYEEFSGEWDSPLPYCLVRTSGSTGTPKEIQLPKSLMRVSAGRTLDFFSLRPGDSIHSCISPDFIGGKMMLVRAKEGALSLTWEHPSNRPGIFSIYPDSAPLLVALVPSQLPFLLDEGIPQRFMKTVWLIGGSAIDPHLRRRIVESGIMAWESYGMTETSSHIALRRVTEDETAFHPFDGVDISLDTRGCLVIRQEGIEVVTNDMAEILPDGGFHILGRADNVIITGGKKVHPERVENILMKELAGHGIAGVMAKGEPDEKWTNRLILLVKKSPDCGLDEAAINEISRALLPPYEVPKEIRFVEELPLTPNGKLRRR